MLRFVLFEFDSCPYLGSRHGQGHKPLEELIISRALHYGFTIVKNKILSRPFKSSVNTTGCVAWYHLMSSTWNMLIFLLVHKYVSGNN